MISLNQHLAQLDEDAAREEAVIDLSEQISDQLLSSKAFYQPGLLNVVGTGKLDTKKDYWHLDDFIADVCIDNSDMTAMLKGNADLMMEDMQEKFEAFCMDAAEKSIDEEMEIRNEQ